MRKNYGTVNGMRFLSRKSEFLSWPVSTRTLSSENRIWKWIRRSQKKREKGRRNGTYPIKTILHEYILLEVSWRFDRKWRHFQLKYPQIKTEIMIWFSTCSKTFQLFAKSFGQQVAYERRLMMELVWLQLVLRTCNNRHKGW